MNRHVTSLAVAFCLSLTTGAVWARGPSTPYPVEQHGQVRLVNKQQQVIILEDGTVLTATSPQQLEVQSGNAVKVLFVEEGGTKRLQRIDVTR
jgi:hypothetical protein